MDNILKIAKHCKTIRSIDCPQCKYWKVSGCDLYRYCESKPGCENCFLDKDNQCLMD